MMDAIMLSKQEERNAILDRWNRFSPPIEQLVAVETVVENHSYQKDERFGYEKNTGDVLDRILLALDIVTRFLKFV